MPVNPTYPGVYIEEVPSEVRTITGVSTSRTAFIGKALRGRVNEPELIFSFADYIRQFGGLWKKSNLSYAVYQYFLNGGKEAVIVRVYKKSEVNGKPLDGEAKFSLTGSNLKLKASNPGLWGEQLKIAINHEVDGDKLKEDETLFNLTIHNEKTGARETFLNVSTNKDEQRFVKIVLEEESGLVRVDGDVTTEVLPDGNFLLEPNSASDGDELDNDTIKGDPDKKEGIYALDSTDIFNLLCIPPYEKSETTSGAVYTEAVNYCEKRRAMLIVDPPNTWKKWKDAEDGVEPTELGVGRSANAAIFFPRIKVPDPENEYRLREFVPCGAVAGVIARTDGQRGIWKSPAGTEAILTGVSNLAIRLTDDENGQLNPLGINCLRIMPVVGPVVWGARTMKGADRLADQWKYLAVRRMALYIEESLYEGTQWVVFEPNDEPLWSQIRLNVGAFMHGLFRQGAFQGTTPKQAYFVKCDKETTTRYDIDRGIVNIIVGFAPLKPAEFVILKIQQIAGQEAA